MSDATQGRPSRAEPVTDSSDARDAGTLPTESGSGRAASAPDGRSHRLRRLGGGAAVVAMVAGSTVAFAPAATAAVTQPTVESAAARAAIIELTGDHPWEAVIPGDFQARQGYRPAVTDGLLGDPNGGCSSPIAMPPDFDSACKAHDLGYDMLRYADREQQPLGPWARQAVDAALEQRMYSACGAHPDSVTHARCEVLAGVATTAVDLNSRRQNYATPVPEYVFGTELSGSDLGSQAGRFAAPAAAGAAALVALLVGLRWARRRGYSPLGFLRRRPRIALPN
ncbi:hypothetical protein [Nocardia sp. BMG51109]|uniref:hypothetical protein n=1 Tax=Nocardia sp. BMG51109 TaxID=1056816 RepID=UPI000465C612|nr:hypothetical protein [Nocardia sp. BMG51109]